jgi:hypothetical protein
MATVAAWEGVRVSILACNLARLEEPHTATQHDSGHDNVNIHISSISRLAGGPSVEFLHARLGLDVRSAASSPGSLFKPCPQGVLHQVAAAVSAL